MVTTATVTTTTTVTVTVVAFCDSLLLETGVDYLLLETGDQLVLENMVADDNMERVVIVWGADSHYTVPTDPNYYAPYANGVTYLASFVAAANALNPDLVVITGDIAHQSSDMVVSAGAVLDGLGSKYIAMGNNDVGTPVMTPEQCAAQKVTCVSEYAMASEYHAFDMKFLRVLVLDTNFDGENDANAEMDGHIPSAEMTWVGDEIAGTDKDAVLVLMHHWLYNYMDNDATLVAELEDLDHIFVFSGHAHLGGTWSYKLNGAKTHEWNLAPLFLGRYAIVTITYYVDVDSYDVHVEWRQL